jgi:hypothetical protein
MDKNVQTVLAVAITAIIVFAVMQYGIPTWRAQSASSYATLTVTYTDGTSKIFDSRQQAIGQAIIDLSTGKTVSSINTNLNIIPTFTGTVQSYTVSGSLGVQIKDVTTGATVYDSGAMALSPVTPLPTLSSGSSSIIASSTISGSGLQSLYSGWKVTDTYALVDYFSNVKVTITFTDGSQASQTAASGSITWQFKYQSDYSFTSLSVTFSLSSS